jgi:hypothetical protein
VIPAWCYGLSGFLFLSTSLPDVGNLFLGVYDRSAPRLVRGLSETDFRGTPGSALAHVQVEPATAERLYRQIHAALQAGRSVHHQTISLDLAGAIIADLEVTEDRIDGLLYAVEGWHPDLGRVVVIEGSVETVLVSEVPLPNL